MNRVLEVSLSMLPALTLPDGCPKTQTQMEVSRVGCGQGDYHRYTGKACHDPQAKACDPIKHLAKHLCSSRLRIPSGSAVQLGEFPFVPLGSTS